MAYARRNWSICDGIRWTLAAMRACTCAGSKMECRACIQGDEMRALRELKRSADSPFVFISERGTPFTRAGFAKMVARLGQEAGFKFGVHPHMLRHACGYALVNRGHDTRALQAYLGHKNIQHTVRYTELSPT